MYYLNTQKYQTNIKTNNDPIIGKKIRVTRKIKKFTKISMFNQNQLTLK